MINRKGIYSMKTPAIILIGIIAVSALTSLAAVHQGDYRAVRIDTCPCKEGVCIRGRAVKNGKATRMVYTSNKESTDFHWAVTDGWELYNVTKDPGCENELSAAMPELRQQLTKAYDGWWDDVYPEMIKRGGDAPIPGSKGH
jgi:hypothetical protein